MDAAPTEATGPPVADPPPVTRLTAEEGRRVFPTRRKLTDEQAREVARLYAETDTPVEAIARQFSISQASVYRLAQRPGCPCARQPLRAHPAGRVHLWATGAAVAGALAHARRWRQA